MATGWARTRCWSALVCIICAGRRVQRGELPWRTTCGAQDPLDCGSPASTAPLGGDDGGLRGCHRAAAGRRRAGRRFPPDGRALSGARRARAAPRSRSFPACRRSCSIPNSRSRSSSRPVLVDAAFDASPRDLRANWRPIASLALGAVALTIVMVALVARWLVPDMPWAAAVALGAIVAPPDAAAASAVLQPAPATAPAARDSRG